MADERFGVESESQPSADGGREGVVRVRDRRRDVVVAEWPWWDAPGATMRHDEAIARASMWSMGANHRDSEFERESPFLAAVARGLPVEEWTTPTPDELGELYRRIESRVKALEETLRVVRQALEVGEE